MGLRWHPRLTALTLALLLLALAGGAQPAAQSGLQAPADTPGARLQRDGLDAFTARRYDAAERAFIGALAAFEAAGSLVDQAHSLRNLSFLPRLTTDQRIALTERALDLAGQSGDDVVTGLVGHQLSDLRFIEGDFAAAFTLLDAALTRLEAPPVRTVSVARALTSRGRLLRAIGRGEDGLADQARAASLLESVNDLTGASQAHHGRALNLLSIGRYEEAITAYEAAIALARRSGNPDRLAQALAQAASALAAAGQAQKGLPLLREADTYNSQVVSSARAIVIGAWSEVLEALGRFDEALVHVEAALASTHIKESRLLNTWDKAGLLQRLGRTEEGFATAQDAMRLGDELWRQMVPLDAAKRGYVWRHSQPMSRYVGDLSRAGRHDEALQASERARGRAFLDLLASAESMPALLRPLPTPAARSLAPWVPVAARPVTPERVEPLLATRGAAPPDRARSPEPDISTVAIAEPPRLATVVAQAARLRTHLLCYWVTSDTLLIWVVSPEGRIVHREVPMTQARVTALVDQTLPGHDVGSRGSAGDRLTMGGDADRAYRTLYTSLIAPVASELPLNGRGLVTIVPHGPLYRLSFAALRAPSGKYLIELTAIHYSSSASALAFTGSRRGGGDGGPLVVADPRISAASAPDLAELPGAVEEGRAVSRALGQDRTTVLRGASATEQAFRGAAAAASVIHIAAHGVVKDDDPFGSFIALAGADRAPDSDGRLTSSEVYGLRLRADLVVLSGCRTAVGPVTGDGMLGLTRGFFAAGAPSVIASLWDVSDTVTASLFARFYRNWPTGASKAAALRRAQLGLIADLRAGRTVVDTPAGRFTLPEHPSLWAGLVLVGEP